MKLDFRIDWGYQYLYSRRHYHPTFIWDGELCCDNGKIDKVYKLFYPVLWYGPGHSAKETLLPGTSFKDKTKRGLSGIRVEAEVEENATFTLTTASGTFTFLAADIVNKGRIEFAVGPKYLGCFVTVTKTGYLWFRNPVPANGIAFEAKELGLPLHDWSRMTMGWMNPGDSLKLKINVPAWDADVLETVLHTEAMAVPAYTPEKETPVVGDIPLRLSVDGKEERVFTRHYRYHDQFMQILEDEWQRLRLPAGEHVITLTNLHETLSLAVSRVVFTFAKRNHGELSIPAWALTDEKVVSYVFSTKVETLLVTVGDTTIPVCCKEGWNEFPVCAHTAGDTVISSAFDSKVMEVYACEEEENPVKVGYDMTEIPHDDNGFMDWLLEYTHRTRLGNYVVFRSFNGEVPDPLLTKWADYCRTHGIYVSSSNCYKSGALVKAAGEMFSDCGPHEYSGAVYAFDPTEKDSSADMKEAHDKFLRYLREGYDAIHAVSPFAAMGDASGGIRYAFMAGADSVRAETMVGHNMTLLSQARPAAEALGRGQFGVHIAIQHHYQPYRETHLGQYFLSMMQPWAMGADTIYEEDSLFGLWKEERQCWDDLLTKGKRDMTRNFFRFAKTHPRRGRCVRNIAFVEGRYAAPFNGFICDSEQTPHYSVWGRFGNNNPTWGHAQPEKCRQLLDVLMPGANTHPLRQQYDKRRFFFSGTPYGDFDCVPTEASADFLKAHYRLLLHLGWNTMVEEDHQKLLEYVQNGGSLLIGIPQFFTNVDREFLADMDTATVWNNGDLSALCGLTVEGKGEVYSGQFNCTAYETLPTVQLSAAPSDSVDEDGIPCAAKVNLSTATVVAWDKMSGAPLLTANKVGKGTVYTFTLWAYPGHEQFQQFAATIIADLCRKHASDIFVEDESREVFWSRWDDNGKTTLMLLNTDWSTKGNQKTVTLITDKERHTLQVTEREILLITVEGGKVTQTERCSI